MLDTGAAEPEATVPPDRRRGWSVVAAVFVVAVFAWGLGFYGLGLYLRDLSSTFGWSVTAVSLVTFTFHLTATWLTFVVSHRLARHGPRPVFLVGAVALPLGTAAVGLVGSLWQLVPAYLVLAIGWACCNSNPISATVLAWFPERSGAPLSVALTGASVGGIALIPALDAAVRAHGLRTALAATAAVAALVLVPLAGLVIRSPRSPTRRSAADRRQPPFRPYDSPRFWSLSLGLALGIAAQVGLLVHQLTHLDDGFKPGTGARLVALTTAAALAGRLAFVALVDRRASATVLGCAFLAAQAVALATLAASRSTPAVTVACGVFGLGVGVLITIPPLLVRRSYPDVPFTTAFPVVNVGYQLAIATGPPSVAIARDLFDGYRPTFAVLALADVAAVVLLAWNGRLGAQRGHGGHPPAR
ncbi:MAG: MFS transporter [Acidimicrobiales bacterium]